MSINNINSTSAANTGNTPLAKTNNNSGGERNMFMTLLVAQLKNQDPLQPQDGTQFVAQLAQFNSLDQLVNIRQSLEQLISLTRQPAPTDNTDAAQIVRQIQQS